ncbi:c-type cytochrome [Novosphingobium panipatense]
MQIYMMATLSLVGSVVILGLGVPVASEASQQKGQAQFIRCAACHSTRAADRPSTGPHLEGIVGRKAGAVTNFTYSERLRKGISFGTKPGSTPSLQRRSRPIPACVSPSGGWRRQRTVRRFLPT